MERIKFCFVDSFNLTYPPEEVVCNLCNKVVKFKDMSEHRRYCSPADWRMSEKYFIVRETCEEITEKINEVISK